MRISIIIFLASVFILASCTLLEKETASDDFDLLMKQYYEDRLRLNPLEATFAGDNRYNDLLPNYISEDYRKQVMDFYRQYSYELSRIDKSRLTKDDQTNYDVLRWEFDMEIDRLRFNSHLTPVNQMWSMPIFIGQLAGGGSVQPFRTVKDYDNWLSRLNQFMDWCDTAISNMRIGMARGYTLPKPLVSKIIPQFEGFDHGPVEKHLFYSLINNLPDSFPDKEKIRLSETYRSIIKDKIIPKYKEFKVFLQNEYLPACRTSSGINAVPNGKEYYDFLIKYYTTTDLTADEVFSLGQKEVARITREMELVKDRMGFKGDLKEFFKYLKSNAELMPFTEPEQVIANFNAIHQRMKPALTRLFNVTPKTAFEVRRIESFREAGAVAQYVPGSIDGTRPGIFYVPIPNVRKYYVLSDETIFLHEAIPGHHYQGSLQQENTSLPDFRRILWYSAYGEGWAVYAQSLGKELGLYADPYQYFGYLSGEMYMAVQLVVDVGIHAKGWTREQAIQYSKDHEAEPEASIISKIERYMAMPGQALSYKVGQLKILELRTKAERELGDKFDIAEFHAQILDPGCIPLNILEDKIVHWIESEKTRHEKVFEFDNS